MDNSNLLSVYNNTNFVYHRKENHNTYDYPRGT